MNRDGWILPALLAGLLYLATWLIALIVWPAVVALPAFVVALALGWLVRRAHPAPRSG